MSVKVAGRVGIKKSKTWHTWRINMKTLDKQKIKTAINIQTGDDGTQAKKILEILEMLERMTLEEYRREQKFYG